MKPETLQRIAELLTPDERALLAGPELVICYDRSAAKQMGFSGQTMPGHPHIRAWWPSLGLAGLYSRPLQRVTVTAPSVVWTDREAVALIRSKMAPFGASALWIGERG